MYVIDDPTPVPETIDGEGHTLPHNRECHTFPQDGECHTLPQDGECHTLPQRDECVGASVSESYQMVPQGTQDEHSNMSPVIQYK